MIRHGDSIVKVLDFGLAKTSERVSELTRQDLEAATRAKVNTRPGVVMLSGCERLTGRFKEAKAAELDLSSRG